jgi:signal peptidase II
MFALDQWTKNMVIEAMPITVDVINQKVTQAYPSNQFTPILWITHVVNFGAAFSIFYGKKYLLLAFASIISLAILGYEWSTRKTRTKLLSFSIGFILSGALGNLYDRAKQGYVTDFFDLRYNGENIWPIFNVADIAIDIGIGLLILYFIFQEGKEEAKKELENMEDDEIVK